MSQRPVLLYYEILGYQEETLAALASDFEVVRVQSPDFDSDDVLSRATVALAPLGHEFGQAKIDRCPNLRVIASSTLVVPHIDRAYADVRGITVCWIGKETGCLERLTPTAELAWGLVLALTRHLNQAFAAATAGRWGGRPFGQRTPRMLSQMTLGVVGLGRLGRMVARYGKAFGMPVRYYSPNSVDATYERVETLQALAGQADVVSVHVALTGETRGLLDESFFRALRPGAFLVNTSRGAVVDERALLEALESGHLAGAALDALADEYEPGFVQGLNDQPLVRYARTHDNLILTPHYGGATVDAWQMTESAIVGQIERAMVAGAR